MGVSSSSSDPETQPRCDHAKCAEQGYHGGGRPRKREKYADAYKASQDELHALLLNVPDSLRELIEGVYEEDEHGHRVYSRLPDVRAILIVLEQTIGRLREKRPGPEAEGTPPVPSSRERAQEMRELAAYHQALAEALSTV